MNEVLWTAHKTPDGRVYYYNTQTKQSSWSKPEALQTSAEKALSALHWEEFTTESGEKYYYNGRTKITTWTIPEELDSKKISGSSPKALERKDVEPNTGASIKDLQPKNEATPQQAATYSQEKAEEIFKSLLDDCGISSTDTWEEALPKIINDQRYRSLKTLSQRKAFFDKHVKSIIAEEESRKKEQSKRQKDEMFKILSNMTGITSTISYASFIKLFSDNELFQSIPEDNRFTIYVDYTSHLEKIEKNALRETRKTNINKFQKILDDLVKDGTITVESRWSDVEKTYTSLPEYKNDPVLQSMDEDDFLIVYKDLIDKLKTSYRKEKREKEEEKVKRELENRRTFSAFLESLVESGKITYKTVWLDVYPLAVNEQSYRNLLLQHGASPVDLFGEVIYKLLKDFWHYYSRAKKSLAFEKIKVNAQSKPGELAKKILSFNIPDLSSEIANDIAEELVRQEKKEEKAELKKDEEWAIKKKLEMFKKYIKKNMSSFSSEPSWEQVKSRIKNSSEYKSMNQKTRQLAFSKYADRIKEGLNKYRSRARPSPRDESKQRYYRHRREIGSKEREGRSHSQSKRKHRSTSTDSYSRRNRSPSSSPHRDDSAEEGEVR